MPIPIDPRIGTSGAEWQIQSPAAPAGGQQSGQSFGGALEQAISSLDDSQNQATAAAQSLTDGTATDASSVVMTVERAKLAMQLASQIRTQAVQAYQDVFHTQV